MCADTWATNKSLECNQIFYLKLFTFSTSYRNNCLFNEIINTRKCNLSTSLAYFCLLQNAFVKSKPPPLNFQLNRKYSKYYTNYYFYNIVS